MILNKINSFNYTKSLQLRLYSVQPLKKTIKKGKWKSVVGLEIHAQIASNSKLFSGAKTEFGAPVNNCVSLFDCSIPGTLPVLNKRCVEAGIKTAAALSSKINAISMFDRKHYFYADLPTGYQITQQRQPLAQGGFLKFPVFVPGVTKKPYFKSARIHQIQLEQDSGKSLHDEDAGRSLVDLNRAGVPLMELVFEPDLEDGEEAAAMVKELMLILTRLETCSCKMEEGALRVDANISIHQENEPYGTRTEVKNIGSVRGVAQAIAFEINRQIDVLNDGGVIHNETRSWDANSKTTVPMRDKEVQQDYRFMPEPNLPPLHLNLDGEKTHRTGLIDVKDLIKGLPEMPEDTRRNLVEFYNLTEEIAIILVNEPILLNYFKEITEENKNRTPKVICNILINELLSLCHKNKMDLENCKIKSSDFGQLIDMIQNETINLYLGKLILHELLINSEGTAEDIATKNNWIQIKDTDLIKQICLEVLEANPKMVKQFQEGKIKVLYALAGEISKKTEQKANMSIVVDILKEVLKSK